MRYTNRLCHLLSGGFHIASVALLYHAEAEWSGGEYMLTQKPARELTENQIDFDIIPADVFSESAQYRTNLEEGLRVNTQTYKVLVIPAARFLPDAVAKAAGELHRQGFPVIFVDRLPEKTCTSDEKLLDPLKNCPVVSLGDLVHYLRGIGCYEIEIDPANNRLRYYHYHNGGDIFLFVNEGIEVYSGIIKIPLQKSCFVYNAWDNRIERAAVSPSGNGVRLSVHIEPRKSLAVIFGEAENWPIYETPVLSGGEISFSGWKRSLCKGIEYPNFNDSIPVELPDSLVEQKPEFSGFVRYETEFVLDKIKPLLLEISNAAEGVEVFVNGRSVGIQIVPPFCFDLSGFVQVGENMLAIETATTLERERYANMTNPMEKARAGEPSSCSGITGIVKLKY
jgi:hypothetical protein